MAYVGWNSVANQANTTTGAALEVNGQVTSSLYFGAGMGGEGATNLMLAPSLNLNFALFGQTTLDPRITFSRTTNATVTNSAGVITYAPHNLLTNSESFEASAWVKSSGGSISSNSVISPTGETNADAYTRATTTSAFAYLYQSITATSNIANTFSIWLKRPAGSGSRTIRLAISDVTTSTGNSSTFTVTENWQRFEYTRTSTYSTNQVGAGINPGSTGTPLGSGEIVEVWGAQLEVGSTATTYNSTTVKNLLGYSELFDNAAWTKSNSFVQTNLLTYSEDFTVAGWAKTTVTATANSFIAPNGYQTADTLLATGANSTALQTFTASAVPYTFSVYLYRKTGTGNIDITVDGTTWVTKTITAGWTRVDTTLTPAAGSKTAGIRIATNGDEVYAWGAQLVQGSVAGDYRRTDAAALPVYYPNHNGVVCAEKLVENTGNSTHAISEAYIAAIGTVVTFSCYMKAIDRNWARLTVNTVTGANASAYFNLSTGNVGSIAGGTARIVSAGNGWYRCSITGTLTTTNPTLAIFLANGDTGQVYTGDGTSGIYIFGAQLSASASLDPYVLNAAAAPTAAAYYGARFDYDPVTLAPKGLLIEEQRTNLVLQSQALATTPWTSANSGVGSIPTVTNNYAISPDGTQNATRLQMTLNGGTTTTDYSIVSQNITISNTTVYTSSFYAKTNDNSTVIISFRDSTAGTSNTLFTITPTWQRFTVTGTSTGTTCAFRFWLRGGIGTSDTADISIYGAQLEAGAFATSYIPTAASQVTRAADVATIQGSNFYSWYNQNTGSVVANWSMKGYSAFNPIVDIGTDQNNMISISLNSAQSIRTVVVYNTATVANLVDNTVVYNSNYKQSIAYNTNDFSMVVNAGTVLSDSSGNVPLANQMTIGNAIALTRYLNGTIKQISYYPQRLSDSVLKGLTA